MAKPRLLLSTLVASLAFAAGSSAVANPITTSVETLSEPDLGEVHITGTDVLNIAGATAAGMPGAGFIDIEGFDPETAVPLEPFALTTGEINTMDLLMGLLEDRVNRPDRRTDLEQPVTDPFPLELITEVLDLPVIRTTTGPLSGQVNAVIAPGASQADAFVITDPSRPGLRVVVDSRVESVTVEDIVFGNNAPNLLEGSTLTISGIELVADVSIYPR